MELPGELYLFNLSLLAVTFSAVSALVTLLRQTMGGKMSNFDVFLVNVFVAHGFMLAIAAILPSLIAQLGFHPPLTWTIASVLAAALIAAKLLNTLTLRRVATPTPTPMSFAVKLSFALHWAAVLLLLLNAALPGMRGAGYFQLGVTTCLATIMWSFARRVSSLIDESPSADWDPKRG